MSLSSISAVAMAGLTLGDQDGISRSISNTPPSHYIVKIQSWSSLAKHNIDKYTTSEFEAGGYKWKLSIYPNGNKNKNINDHISVYLMMVEKGNNSLRPGWEVHAVFRFFLLDQINDCYLLVQDNVEKGRRFHRLKPELGFDKLIPLTTLNDPSSGYLVNDTCVFGAEVYVSHEKITGKGEALSMIKDPISYKHTWRILNFSKLNPECDESNPFNIGDHKWKIQIYPNGKGSGIGNYISLYLALADPTSLPPETQIHAEFTLRMLDQINAKHYFGKANYWFSASNTFCGWPRFISMSYFNSPNAGLLMKNSCIVEAEVNVQGVANAL